MDRSDRPKAPAVIVHDRDTPPHSTTNFLNLLAALIYFGYTNTKDNITTIYLDWTIVFRHPIQISISLLAVPALLIFFSLAAILLGAAGLLGLGSIVVKLGDIAYHGNASANWGDPDPLTDIDVDAGLVVMGAPNVSSQFDVAIAKTLLFFSALMYESSSHATDLLRDALKTHDLHSATSIELKEDQRIGEFIEIFTLSSTTSEIKTIIIAVRGTSPFDLNEWLIDLSMKKTDGSEYLVGDIHEGFFRSLFLNRRNRTTNSYKEIINKVNEIVETFPEHSKIRVWVTGHSLGAGIGSLIFARAAASRQEIRGARLSGGYTFGSPRVGNLEFRNEHTLRENTPFDNSVRLYRCYNTNDPVPLFPPGIDDPNVLARARGSSGQQQIDFIHIGTPIFLHRHTFDFPDQHIPFAVKTLPDLYFYFLDNIIVSLNLSSIIDYLLGWVNVLKYIYTFLSAPNDVNFIKLLVEFLMQLIVVGNHLPSTYLANLDERHIQLPNPKVSFH